MSSDVNQDKEVKINLAMPKVLVKSDCDQESIEANKLMRSLAGACAFMVQKNYAVQECMDMLSYIHQDDDVLHLAFNHERPIDLDHFRMMMVSILSAVEGEAGIQRVSICQPIDFERSIRELSDQEANNPS